MGIDILFCSNCGDGFPDVGDYEDCDGCGNSWCDDVCAEYDGLEKILDEEGYQMNSSCKYCRNEDVEDSKLLDFAISQLGCDSRTDLVDKYFDNERKINE